MNINNHFESYISLQSINSDAVIACIDAFFSAIDKTTVIVVEQAAIHTSNVIWEKLAEWWERGTTRACHQLDKLELGIVN